MRLILLTRFHSRHSQSAFLSRLVQAGAALGHTVSLVNPSHTNITFNALQTAPQLTGLEACPVRLHGQSFPVAQLIVPIARWDDTLTWQVAETLHAWGQPVILHQRIPLGDHITMARLFMRRGIPSPHTWVFASSDQLTVALPEINFPCLIRSRSGGGGRAVSIAQHSGEAMVLADQFTAAGHHFLVQDLPAPLGQDVRVLVVDGQVVASIARQAPPGFARPRETGNANVQVTPLSADETKLVLAAAQLYNAPYCAVSLLRSEKGPLLLDVSRAPVLTELEQVTNQDLATPIVEHLVHMAQGFQQLLKPLGHNVVAGPGSKSTAT
jgi:glutathione synthase/RimK-type ligase-like ATP-grasp enzyme